MPVRRAALVGWLALSLHSQRLPGPIKSLFVDGIDQQPSGLYLRLRNTSYKDLVGYSLSIGDRFESVPVSNTPVVAARATSRVRVQNPTVGPGAGQPLLRAALFADGSYEGDPAAAAALVIPGMAADVERKRIVNALEPMIANDDPLPFDEVRLRISQVTTHMDVVSVLEMSGRFPSLGDWRDSPFRAQFEEAARAQRDLFLNRLDEMERQRTVSLQEALRQLANQYARELL